MKLIVGLGNPGPKYQITRHNIGFMLVDALAEVFSGGAGFKSEFKALTLKIKVGGQNVLICKPQTFMNLSGEAVQPLMKFYDIQNDDLLVGHDEVDLPFQQMKFQFRRGHGGHNGIRNIHQMLGTDAYARLRLGVGRPPVFVNDAGEKIRASMEVHEWVLSAFSKDEFAKLPDFLEVAIQGVEVWAADGWSQAASKFNSKDGHGT